MERFYQSKITKLLCSKFVLFFSFFAFSLALGAQSYVSGTVTDSGGEPLIGANILVKGTSVGTVTDFDGNYSLEVPEGASTFIVSYTGYSTQEIPITGGNMDIVLQEGLNLSEVVVTGYTTDSRRNTPGSVSTVKAVDIQAVPSGNVEQQLQGRVPGVTVISNGQPGTTSQVRVRGYGALGGNQPLYIVDGVPTGSVDFISPDDVESITVLKDASSASIYGARAAGGVIVYTTKHGQGSDDGRIRVSYDGVFGGTNPGNGPDMLNPQEQAEWTWAAIRNGALLNGEEPEFNHPQYGTGPQPVLPDYLLIGSESGVTGSINLSDYENLYNVNPEAGSIYQVVKANKAGTDWYDELTRNGGLMRHNLGFSGGGDNSRFYLGMGYQNQDGIVNHQNFKRYTLRLNSSFDVLPWLRFGENFQVTRRETRLLFGAAGGSGSTDDENIINMAYRMSPIIPVYDEFGGYAGTAAPGFNNPANPVATTDGMQDNRARNNSLFGNLFLEIMPVTGLTLRSSLGGNYGYSDYFNFSRRTYENSENNSSFGYGQGNFQNSGWVWTNTAQYETKIGDDHDLNIIVGQEALNDGTYRNVAASGLNPFSQNPDFVSLSTVNSRVVNGGHSNGVNFNSYFGQLRYIFANRYILSGIVRRDGSSRFGSANRYGTFPAFSAAWRISEESFMANSTFFDDLRVRFGYGIMGNSNNVDPNNQYSLYGTSIGNSSYDIGGGNSSASEGFYRTRIGNPNAKWERAVTSNFGLDALMLNGRLDFGIEVWRKNTEDLLFQLPVTVQSGGFASAPSVNVGKMKNNGVDFTLALRSKSTNEFGWEVGFTGGFLKNEIVELAEGIQDLPDRSSSYRGVTPILNQVGQPLSTFFGYDVEGLFQDSNDVKNHATQEGAAPGRFKFRDVNGDGVITIDDRVPLGNPIPDFTGGLTLKFDYKNFEVNAYSYMSIGNEIYNISRLFTDMYPLFPGAAISSRVKDSWSDTNRDATIPIFETNSNFSTNTQSNSFYVEDGSYFRLQNLTVGYNVPNSNIDSWGLSRLRLYGTINNLFTISDYSGLDPSIGGNADTNFGIDVGNFPITRSWTLGVNLGF